MKFIQIFNGIANIVLTYMSQDLELDSDEEVYHIMFGVGESAGNLIVALFDV